MKKIIPLILVICFLLCSCGEVEVKSTDYPLREAFLDDTRIAAPEGCLTVRDDGIAILNIDSYSCEINLSQSEFNINGARAEIVLNDNDATLTLPELGLKYFFSVKPVEDDSEIEVEEPGTPFTGRIFYSNVENQFIDYEGVSTEVTGKVSSSGYTIYCHSYSDTVPFALLDSEGKGLLMNFDVAAEISQVQMEEGFLIERYDIADPFKFRPWDAPVTYYDEQVKETKDVTIIKGHCVGAFDFEILYENETS